MLFKARLDCLTGPKRVFDNAAHFPMCGNGVVQRMAEAVTHAPAANLVFDKSVRKTDAGNAIQKDARATVLHGVSPKVEGATSQPLVNNFKHSREFSA